MSRGKRRNNSVKYGICTNMAKPDGSMCSLCQKKEKQAIRSTKDFVCAECGEPLTEVPPPRKPPIVLLITLVVIACIVGAYFAFFRDSEVNESVSLSLNKEMVNLIFGDCDTLGVDVTTNPPDANVSVSFTSGNADVAQVDNMGIVQAIAKGETTVTVIAQSTKGVADTAYVKVTVKDKSDTQRMTISLNKEIIDFNVGDCDTLVVDVTANPPDANVSVSFTSDNADVAQVDDMGIVHAIAKGETTVTVVAWSPNGVADTAKVRVSVAEIVPEPKLPCQTKTRNTTIKYSFGEYKGDNKNGIPEGRGTMYYSRHTQIAKHDTGNPPHYAESGDWLDGTWGNGDIISGVLYNKEGRIKEKIFAPKRPYPYKLQ